MSNPWTRPDPPRTLRAKEPVDLLAVAPVILGFWPEESIVMMTFGAEHPFHARLDLPPLEAQSLEVHRQLEQLLLSPARRHHASSVVLLYFDDDLAAATGAHAMLDRACRRAGISVAAALFADGRRYWDLSTPGAGAADGLDYDVSCHPFVVEALVSGRLAHRSRAAMVDSLRAVDAEVAKVSAALVEGGCAEGEVAADGRTVRNHGRWVEELVRTGVRDGRAPGDAELARLLWRMQASRVRDAAWALIRRRGADRQVAWWSAVLRRSPEALAAAPAALLGWACWQAGDGAQAWAAIDRCAQVDPAYPLATYLASLLEAAVPPDTWEGGFDWALGLPAS